MLKIYSKLNIMVGLTPFLSILVASMSVNGVAWSSSKLSANRINYQLPRCKEMPLICDRPPTLDKLLLMVIGKPT